MSLHDDFNAINADTIHRWVAHGREEDLHLDFKALSDASLTRDDRKSVAIALSGFANSDGGIVVWGVDARPNSDGVDCAVAAPEIPNVQLALTRLNELTGQCVSPLVDGVIHKAVSTTEASGFCVSLVPASQSTPHMAKGGEDRYYKRSGTGFYRLEHFDLEDLFGRRPRPSLRVMHRLMGGGTDSSSYGKKHNGALFLGLRNDGKGVARFGYLTLDVERPYKVSEYGLDGNGREGFQRLATMDTVVRYGASIDTVIHPGVTLEITRVKFDVFVSSEGGIGTVPKLRVKYEFAADGVALEPGDLTIPSADLISTAMREP